MSDGRYIGDIEVDYHRNGVSGESFWTCRFTFEDGGTEGPEAFVAVLPSYSDDEEETGTHEWGRCYVLRVRDLIDGSGMMRWRGDDFENVLRHAIRRAREIWFRHDEDVPPIRMPIRVPAYTLEEVTS